MEQRWVQAGFIYVLQQHPDRTLSVRFDNRGDTERIASAQVMQWQARHWRPLRFDAGFQAERAVWNAPRSDSDDCLDYSDDSSDEDDGPGHRVAPIPDYYLGTR